MSVVTWMLDADDRFAAVGEGWDAFALANGGDAIAGGRVLGRSLYDFIADRTTANLYRDLHRRLRRDGRRIDFAFRCDSPELRRTLTMQIVPQDDARLAVSTRLLHAEPRAQPAPLVCVRDDVPALPRCSLCGQLDWGGAWREPELALALGLELDVGGAFVVRHRVCPGCERAVERSLDIAGPAVRPPG